MFTIKICGITRIDDALAATDAGADAIGLNFFPKSPRNVSIDVAASIAAALPRSVARIGVFVNATTDWICETAGRVGLDWVQLHGDEPAELIGQLPDDLRVIRAWRINESGYMPLADYLAACHESGRVPDALLLDAFSRSEYGGTGKTLDWETLSRQSIRFALESVILAGGLTPENVAEAIRAAGSVVAAVDTASGVESSPGVKDPARVRAFVAAAATAFEESTGSEKN